MNCVGKLNIYWTLAPRRVRIFSLKLWRIVFVFSIEGKINWGINYLKRACHKRRWFLPYGPTLSAEDDGNGSVSFFILWGSL